MKHLILKTPAFEHLQKAFTEWLDILGHCEMSVYNMPHLVREFLHHLESREGIRAITQLQHRHLKSYYKHITTRGNQRRGGALSSNYLNKQLHAVEKFMVFLHHKGVQDLPAAGLKYLKQGIPEITVLTTDEIARLFAVTRHQNHFLKTEAVNARDRAMLSVFYGCGLRRNEGVHLELNDINFDTRVLHVRKGKNYKERFVPIGKASARYLEEYIFDYRPMLIKTKTESRLFIGVNGTPLNGNSLYQRLKLLQSRIDTPELQQKHLTLHSLRHSIATHLLANGMELQRIQRFLGHTSLESTQIYTHLMEKETSNEQQSENGF